MPIADATYQKFTKLISSIAGIELADNRKTMLVNRISSRLIALNMSSFEHYLEYVNNVSNGSELEALIDVVTTHFTSFFRDSGQFTHLRSELTSQFSRGKQKIRIWSAACSSGEEAYSLGMVALDAAAQAGVQLPDIRVLATDISRQVLQEANEGWFPQASIRNLSAIQRAYFEPMVRQCDRSGVPMVRVNKQLRDLMIFRRVNLCKSPLHIPPNVDIIFCRNVLLYFNATIQAQILGAITNKLKCGGLLYVGASEQVRGFLPDMVSECASVFRKPAALPSTMQVQEACIGGLESS